MRKLVNGQYVDFSAEEINTMNQAARMQAIQERARPLTINEVLEKIVPQTINTVAVDDNTALRMRDFYPEWAPGIACAKDAKFQRDGRLWKVVQPHTSQDGWEPENAASLWTEICETHEGTEEDPIPYSGNMALEQGKYYIQAEHLYRCTRDTGNPVYHALAEMVGLYVEIVW